MTTWKNPQTFVCGFFSVSRWTGSSFLCLVSGEPSMGNQTVSTPIVSGLLSDKGVLGTTSCTTEDTKASPVTLTL